MTKRAKRANQAERRGKTVADHFRSQQQQCEAAVTHTQAENQTEKDLGDRLSLARAGRLEAEGT